MEIDTLRMEAHYCGIINSRNQVIIGLHEEVLKLQKLNGELKTQIEKLQASTSEDTTP